MKSLIALVLLTSAVATRAADAPASLPAFQGGGPLRGVGEAIAPPPYQVRWQFKTGTEEQRASIENNPTIAGDTVYVADSNGVLHAISLADGNPLDYKSEGGFATTPLVLKDRIYLGDLDGFLHCISVDKGAKLWAFDTEGGSIHSSANASPDGKTIVFGNDGAAVFGVDAQTGKKLWEGKGGDRINACPAVGYDAAFFTGCDARLLALNLKDGSERYAIELGGLTGSPTILDDRIVAATGEGFVVAYTPDGKTQLWKYEDVDQQSAMFYSSPAAADGIVVLGCRDRQVHAIDAKTGKRALGLQERAAKSTRRPSSRPAASTCPARTRSSTSSTSRPAKSSGNSPPAAP